MLRFLLGLAIGFCIALGMSGRAQVSVSVFGLSKHSESGYCEVNPGLGLNYQRGDFRLGAGRYRNSKCGWTNTIGACYTPLHLGDFSFGSCLLRLTGYRNTPVVAPLPVGAYRVAQGHYVDFFAVKNDDLIVAGAAWRFEW